ncbi:rod shape-determining protein MreC [Helicobacter bizzozeronii]|uniref:rod shape-determining protein MreC n=1 Tax=Helicobacter bizzozeronii TaxID=56877 RepID=UPI000CEE28B7|nr:rod shape-determining protein MreC [Helicobacter bizzozeronii]
MVGKRGILVLGVFFTILYLLDIRGSSSYLSDKIKVFFLNTKDYFVVGYQKHFQQAKMIEDYQQQLQGYRDLKLAYADLISKNKALIAAIGDLENLQKTYAPNTSNLSALLANKSKNPHVCPTPLESALIPSALFTLTRVYGFAKLGDTHQLLLDVKASYPKDQILGMVAFNRTIGIAVQRDGRFVGLLHGDPQTSYSVMVKNGNKVYYGFITSESFNTYVSFLPAYAPIQVGDPVFTSGLDHIFSTGIYVGKVASIEDHYLYKKALLQLEPLDQMIFYTTLVSMP